MDSYLVNRPEFIESFVNNPINYQTLINESMWLPNFTTEETRRNYYFTNMNLTQMDLNNNNIDTTPILSQDISNVTYGKDHAESKVISSFYNNIARKNCFEIVTSDPYNLSLTNIAMEQTEPIDLSCEKKKNSKTAKKKHYQAKSKNHFGSNSEISFPFMKNPNESTLLIMKNVYDIKYHRRPNCDEIFHKDPANPELNICNVCTKHVRSKWHHFQTHYSRNHKCSDCDAVYSRIDTLRTHAKKRHQTVIPRYYFGIPANIWHRVIVQCPESIPARPALGHRQINRHF